MAVLPSNTEKRRGVLKVHLVAEQEAERGELKNALSGLSDPPLELLEASPHSEDNSNGNGSSSPDVAMVVFNGNEEASLSYLHAQAEHSPRPLLFALLHERSPTLMRRVLRAGADELLFLPLDVGDATRALLKISETRRRAETGEGGVVVSLISTLGGVGVSSLAANLALALRHALDKRVAVVDLDLQIGQQSVLLNLEPEHTIVDLIDRKLDSIQLESALTKHPSGVYLLAAPKRIEESERVSGAMVSGALDLMRQLFDFVIVDCGNHIDETSVAAWERSEHLLYLIDQSIGAARCAWRFVDLFKRLGLDGLEPAFVLNRHLPTSPITEEQIVHTLGQSLFAKIPRDEKAMERAQLRGQDLMQVAQGSMLTQAIEELARRIASESETTVNSQSLVSRLFSAFGARS